MKENKGITLITLVITVIILLILSAVAISTLTGKDDILENAKTTVDKYNSKVEEEQAILDTISKKLKKASVGKSDTVDETAGMAGEGTAEEPYIIESIEDLVQFSIDVENGNDFSGKVVKLAQDLDFNNDKSYIDPTRTDMARDEEIALKTEMTSGIGFISIGADDSCPFAGTFDGQGYTIYNLYQDRDVDLLGLFGYVENGSVNNVNVTGTIKGEVSTETDAGSYYIGGVVGQIYSDTDVQIENCSFNGTIEASYYVGGVVGEIATTANTTIKNCTSTGTLKGLGQVGGIVGGTDGVQLTIENCNNKSNITLTKNYRAAGIIAYANVSSVSVKNSTNSGTISSSVADAHALAGILASVNIDTTNPTIISITDCNNTGAVTGEYEVAGILGQVYCAANVDITLRGNDNNGIITSSHAGEQSGVGGIVGHIGTESTATINLEVDDCNNNAIITARQIHGIAGIVGNLWGETTIDVEIKNCNNNGAIETTETTESDGVAGILGNLSARSDVVATINNCINNAGITANKAANVAGILGEIWTNGTVEANVKNCKNKGIIEITTTDATEKIAGIVAKIGTNSTMVTNINNNINTADIITKNAKTVAGIAANLGSTGTMTSTIRNCLNTGNISTELTSGSINHSGILASASSDTVYVVNIQNSVNTGSIGNATVTSVGGMIGSMWPEEAAVATTELNINNCVNVGTITGSTDWGAGGIAGGIETDMDINVTNTFYLADSYNVEEMLGTSKTATELKATGTGSVLATLNTEAQAHSSDAIPYLTWKQNASSYPVINL